MGLFEELERLGRSDTLPMHMPGHKRSVNDCRLASLGARYDITETNGFDDLHDPAGLILDVEKRAASLWGARRSRILVCGSTCGILASVYAATRRGDKVIMARNCHRSVYHAVEICGLDPVYVCPPLCGKYGLFGSLEVTSISNAIAENPDAKAVIITSPTYEGVISSIAEIAKAAHSANMILIVDEAHGAHLGKGGFEDGAVRQGADLVVQSLHKTLSSLTQTAVLHICGDKIYDCRISHAIDVFETSSPSYILMASIDNCINSIAENGLKEWHDNTYAIAEKLSRMKNLSLLSHAADKSIYKFDISKFTVLTGGKISGTTLAEILRREYKIEIEMAAPDYIVAMSGMGDTRDSLERFAAALLHIDQRNELFSDCPPTCVKKPGVFEPVFPARSALEADSELLARDRCCGRVSAEYVIAYPPGVPIVVPGERFTDEILSYVDFLHSRGCNVKSSLGHAPFEYLTLKLP